MAPQNQLDPLDPSLTHFTREHFHKVKQCDLLVVVVVSLN